MSQTEILGTLYSCLRSQKENREYCLYFTIIFLIIIIIIFTIYDIKLMTPIFKVLILLYAISVLTATREAER